MEPLEIKEGDEDQPGNLIKASPPYSFRYKQLKS